MDTPRPSNNPAPVPRPLTPERQREVEALFDRLARLPVLDPRTPDEIIGYGADGLPAE